MNIFKDKYINLFMPNDGVEFLHNIIYGVGYETDEVSRKKAKRDAMQAIEELLKLDLIEVFHWGTEHEKIKGKQYSTKETLQYIDSIWFDGADIPDFYGMIMFKHKDWYSSKFKTLGMTDTMDWKSFVKNNNINLKKLINKHDSKYCE